MFIIQPRQRRVLRALGRSPAGLSAMECGAASSFDETLDFGPLGQEGYGVFLANYLKDIGLCSCPRRNHFVINADGAAWLAAHPERET